MRGGSSDGWRRQGSRGVPRRVAMVLMQCGLVGSGVFLAGIPARANGGPTGIGITDGGCAGGGREFCYSPESAKTNNGIAATWVNASNFGYGHTVSSCTPAECPGAPASTGTDAFSFFVPGGFGTTRTFTFGSTGTYIYFCKIHGYDAMHGAITVYGTNAIQDDNRKVTYGSWTGVHDSRVIGGEYRTTGTAGAKARFTFTGTGVTWVTRKGPDQGIAYVSIDGQSRGTFDLYAAQPQSYDQTYSGLANGRHRLDITVTGKKNPTSTGTGVAVNAFVVGTTTTYDAAPAVEFDGWREVPAKLASGGTYHYSGASGGKASFTWNGTSVDLITSTGPDGGIAAVAVDGVQQGTVDLYSSSPTWHVFKRFSASTAGVHTIQVRVLGTRDASSSGTDVIVDGFLPHK